MAYILIIVSSFMMHCVSKWMKYKLKSESAAENSSGVMKKTGEAIIVGLNYKLIKAIAMKSCFQSMLENKIRDVFRGATKILAKKSYRRKVFTKKSYSRKVLT